MEQEELKQALKNYIEWHALRDKYTDKTLMPLMQNDKVAMAMRLLYKFELREE